MDPFTLMFLGALLADTDFTDRATRRAKLNGRDSDPITKIAGVINDSTNTVAHGLPTMIADNGEHVWNAARAKGWLDGTPFAPNATPDQVPMTAAAVKENDDGSKVAHVTDGIHDYIVGARNAADLPLENGQEFAMGPDGITDRVDRGHERDRGHSYSY